MTHEMRLAKVSNRYAKEHDLNPNHHARVWCLCMNDSLYAPGEWSMQSRVQILNEPGYFVQFDWIAIVDLRIADSAVQAFRKHVEETSEED